MRAIVYSRVSTDSHERDGTSLDTQERACLQLAQVAGCIAVACRREATGGWQPDRRAMARVRRQLRRDVRPGRPGAHREAMS
jgi:DNA invertase Pin-like site-specific DNA recombinase